MSPHSQILVAIKDAFVVLGRDFEISGLSEEVAETIHLAGFGKCLGLESGSATKGDTE